VTDDAAMFEERDPDHSPMARRTLLRGAALAGLAVPFVAACGSSSDSSSDSSQPSGSASGSSSAGGTELAATSAIPRGGGKIFADQKVVVTQSTSGKFKCFSAVCTHQGCLVASVSGGTINCDCHGSKYNINTGAVVGGPAPSPLPSKKIKVTNKEIFLT
jgi:Rieske Fe-S protein